MIQWRIRTEYTFGQTYAPVDRVIARLKEIGCTAAGIVDRDGTWGHVRWHQACREAGIKPMLGVELTVSDTDDETTAMWFLARNADGLRELYRFTSKAFRQPTKTRRGDVPRLYRDDVIEMSGNVAKFAGDIIDEKFLHEANAILDLSPASRILRRSKERIADRLGLRKVNVSDNAFVCPEDRETFELLTDRGLKPSPQYILDDIEATDSEDQIRIKDFDLPQAPMVRADGDLEALCREGIRERIDVNGMDWTEEHEARLQHELKMIKSKDYESYFLVVSDMCRFAKRHMLVGPSRGSAAGSLVCYLSHITEIDPIPPGLYFERFIDESRKDLPDIDLDFPDDKRHMVFEYMAEKYGAESVAHIGTISQFKPKSALIQVCKKLKIPPTATGGVKIAMIERSSADSRANNCLEDTLTETEPGRKLVEMYPEVKRAADLEGHASHTGVHAAGLLVCNLPIEDFCTVTADGIAQIEKGAAESLGLLKIDVLGLRTLGILEDSGIEAPWYSMKFDDPKTFDVFSRNALSGIFQFDGNALRSVSEKMEFRSITDIDAATALARPGPFAGGVTQEWLERRNGKPYEALHPLVEKYMRETYGLPVYQEQTLAIVREIGHFDWKETSTIRKAMSKRMGKEFFDSYWEKFKAGAAKEGIAEDEARKTWELINAMGAWQMNKAHTYSYAVISYWTAWLKANYPMEFAAANLRNAKDEDSAIALLREMVEEGMSYEPFSIEESEESWTVKDGRLIAGFDSLKGFGESKARKFVEARNAGALTDKQREQIAKADSPFYNIFPTQTKYAHLYKEPEKHNILDSVKRIRDIDGNENGSVVLLGRIIQKNLRDSNEEVLIKKRGGKKLTGPTTFLDLRLHDDTEQVLVRIDRFRHEKIGRYIFDNVPTGTTVLVRATFKDGIKFGWAKKVKVLDELE